MKFIKLSMNKIQEKQVEIIEYSFLIIIGFFIITPLYLTLINSFKNSREAVRAPFALPINFTLDNFKNIFLNPYSSIWEMYTNTIIITFISVLIIILVAPLAGYYVARMKNKFAKYLLLFFLLGMMVPQQMIIVSLAELVTFLKIKGTLTSLILIYVGDSCSLAIFFYSKFINTIPYNLEEAAIIDGASKYQVFWKIIFPLLKTATATVIIFIGTFIWNDFLIPFVLFRKGLTITLGIFSAIGPFGSDWGFVFAFVVISSLPILILFIFLQKWFIKGMTAGAVKF